MAISTSTTSIDYHVGRESRTSLTFLTLNDKLP
ncbi:hypothetical protein Q426_00435 [Streptococcus equi subsp. zooepidemicus CY]|nr:hypothetical protein Q426_00435 [Streptococcus equi subsp. zooepidemicus CY]